MEQHILYFFQVDSISELVGEAIAGLLVLTASRQPCPNPKLVRNLANLQCSDPNFTPDPQLYVTQEHNSLILEWKPDTLCFKNGLNMEETETRLRAEQASCDFLI